MIVVKHLVVMLLFIGGLLGTVTVAFCTDRPNDVDTDTFSPGEMTVSENGMTFEQIKQRAISENNELKQAYRRVLQTKRGREGPWTINNSTITATATYGTISGTEKTSDLQTEHTLSSNARLTVPLFPQMQVGGEIVFPTVGFDDVDGPSNDENNTNEEGPISDVKGSVSLLLSPFAAGKETSQAEEAYSKARTNLRYTERRLIYQIEAAFLDLIVAHQEHELAEEKMEYNQERYKIVKEKYELEAATVREVTDAFEELTTARQNYFSAEKQLLNSEKILSQAIGFEHAALEIAPLSEAALSRLIEERGKLVKKTGALQPTSQTVENLVVEQTTLENQLERTWTYRPDVAVSANVNIPEPAFSTGLSFAFSPADIKTDEQKTLRENLTTKKESIAAEHFTIQREKQMLLSQLQFQREMVTLNQSALEEVELTLEETRFLAEQGERTRMELRLTEINVKTARLRLFSAKSELYKTQADLLMLHPTGVSPIAQ